MSTRLHASRTRTTETLVTPAEGSQHADVERGASRPGEDDIDKMGGPINDEQAELGPASPVCDDDEIPIPKNNLWIVMPSLGVVCFVSALDQSILSTALPTIAAEFGASPSQYSWLVTSYLLAQTLMSPIVGRLTDIVGRKPALYVSIGFLFVFSALCGSAKNVTWLIAARALTGVGGGSIVSLTLIVISDIVPLSQRGAFQGYMGAAWGAAGALGPVIGGLLTARATWRWCFWINLPVCGIALALLWFSLNLNPSTGNARELRRTYDFLGLLYILVASALLIVGFSTAADHGFKTPSAYGVIIAGAVILAVAVWHYLTTKRNALIPARAFRNRTTLFFILGSFLNSAVFLPVNILLPQFFQGVKGVGAFQSGIDLIPFSTCVALISIVAGQITSRFHIVRPVVWVGFGLTAIGYGLFYALLSPDVSYATQEGIQVLPAAGIGLAIATPMLVIQASMPPKEMAAVTSAWVLLRSLGATVGVAVFTAVLNDGMRSRFEKIDGYGTAFVYPESSEGYEAIHRLPDGALKDRILSDFADSFKTCWIMGCGIILGALALTLCTKSYSLDSTKRAEKRAATAAATALSAGHQPGEIVREK